MVIIGLIAALILLIVTSVITSVFEAASIALIVIGAAALGRDRKREREYMASQPTTPYKRKIYPKVLIITGAAVQLWFILRQILVTISGVAEHFTG